MNLRLPKTRTALAVFCLLWATGCGRERPLAEGMNVLLVTLDTTRVDYVSPFGGDPRNTPNLQALADRSAIFTRAVSETNVTSPSHVTIMSGLRMVEHGVMGNAAPVPVKVDTLAEAMRRAGYRTGGFPAARLVSTVMRWRGFDVLNEVRGVQPADEISDRALAWLEQPSEQPFFAWVHYFDAHSMYRPPPAIAAEFYPGDPTAGDEPRIADHQQIARKKHGDRLIEWLGETRDPEYPKAMYAAEIHFVDRELGRILERLEQLGESERTVVVVVADHGESLGEHGIFYGHQGIYEPQLRVPLIIHVPGLAPRRSDALVATLDLAPSISQLTGVELASVPSGLSLVPLLCGQESPEIASRRQLIHHQSRHRAVALRDGDWKLIWPNFEEHRLLSSQPQLYNLADDPGELVNLAQQEPERLRSMLRALRPAIEQGNARMGVTPELDAESLEHLRALGYLAK